MEVPLKTMGVDDTQVLDVMVSGDRIIMNEILLIRCGFIEIVVDMTAFSRIK